MASRHNTTTREDVIWRPSPGPQTELLQCPVFEVFYGGARGGGKTDGMLGDFLSHAKLYKKDAIALMVRRQRTELVETIERSKALYARWADYNEQDKMWTFRNGARFRFAYLERDKDAEAYQGHSYTRLYVEEIGNFPSPTPILKMMATLRSGAGVPCCFRATGNPGGPGHQWVKARYITPAPGGRQIIADVYINPYTGNQIERRRVFIPAFVKDNPYLGDDYVATLQMTGSDNLVKAWLFGDWNIVEGAFFDNWSWRNVVKPFVVPRHWGRFRALDWGFATPFSAGWWAIVGDDGEDYGLPRDALLRYREWYGVAKDGRGNIMPNVGVRLTAEELADGIKQRSGDEKYLYSIADPAIFSEHGGPSIAERMAIHRVEYRRGDNRRLGERGHMGGWDQLRARIGGIDERPMLYTFDTCVDFIRTLPVMQHDPDRPEDLDTKQEDHAVDEARYGVMSRPWQPPLPVAPPPPRNIHTMTMEDAWKHLRDDPKKSNRI